MHDDRKSPASDARKELRAAWDDMMAELERARDAIDVPELMPAPPNGRNLAEGYRYPMGFVRGAVERALHADPNFPVVRHVVQIGNKATIDNADAIYFAAPIDGRQSYVLRGRAQDHRHWRGSPPAESGRKAPQYLIFEVSDGCLAGDSGSLAELSPGVKLRTGKLDSTEIEVEEDGRFAVLLAPERPAGYTGNFIPTMQRASRPNPDDAERSLDRYASFLSGRQLFYDWEREDPVPLSITALGREGANPPPYGPEALSGLLARIIHEALCCGRRA